LAANTSSRWRVQCRFDCRVPAIKFDGDTELHLYYIAQEALMNAVNHGKATAISMTIENGGDSMKLVVQDNGSGFDMSGKKSHGLGIRIMKYRARVIGATLEVQSTPNQGTIVECVCRTTARVLEEAKHG
jgi:signal transduction histidine kinase